MLHDDMEYYLQRIEQVENLAPETVTVYERYVRRLEEYVSNQGITSWSVLNERLLSSFFKQMKPTRGPYREYSSSSMALATDAVRRFCHFLMDEKILTEDPARHFKYKKAKQSPKEPRQPLSEAEEAAVLDALKVWYAAVDPLWGAVFLGLRAGLRRSEMLSLKWERVDFEKNVITVWKGKGGKTRYLPIDQSLRDVLSNLKLLSRSVYVLGQQGNKPHSRTWIRDNLNRLGIRAGLQDGRLYPHVLRHTFATRLVMHAVGLTQVHALLGHADLSATQRYVTLPNRTPFEAVESFPRISVPRPKQDRQEPN